MPPLTHPWDSCYNVGPTIALYKLPLPVFVVTLVAVAIASRCSPLFQLSVTSAPIATHKTSIKCEPWLTITRGKESAPPLLNHLEIVCVVCRCTLTTPLFVGLRVEEFEIGFRKVVYDLLLSGIGCNTRRIWHRLATSALHMAWASLAQHTKLNCCAIESINRALRALLTPQNACASHALPTLSCVLSMLVVIWGESRRKRTFAVHVGICAQLNLHLVPLVPCTLHSSKQSPCFLPVRRWLVMQWLAMAHAERE